MCALNIFTSPTKWHTPYLLHYMGNGGETISDTAGETERGAVKHQEVAIWPDGVGGGVGGRSKSVGEVASSIFTSHFWNEIVSSAHTSHCGGGQCWPISLDVGRLLSICRNPADIHTAAGPCLHPQVQFSQFVCPAGSLWHNCHCIRVDVRSNIHTTFCS